MLLRLQGRGYYVKQIFCSVKQLMGLGYNPAGPQHMAQVKTFSDNVSPVYPTGGCMLECSS
jgi:hypothetical protein